MEKIMVMERAQKKLALYKELVTERL